VTDFVFLNGLLFGLVLAAPVGPVGVICVQRTITEGRLHGLLSGLGAAFGDALYGAVAAFGISWVAAWINNHQTVLRVVGGIVLLILAARTIMRRPRTRAAAGAGDNDTANTGIHTESLFQDFVSTFLLAVSNPITLLTFAGLLAMLGVTHAGESVEHAGWLIAGVFLGSAVWWMALSMTAGCFRGLIDGTYDRWVTRISATILIAFAVYALGTAFFLEF
jgi:threonine/homoserine/homoserine lactone efflux protein